jgi:beta-N-acetylhexosaminidase
MDSIRNWVTIIATSMALVIPFPPMNTEGHSAAPAAAETHLTPRQLAGQRVIYSYPGLTPPQSLIKRIKAGEAAGVIFFKENVQSTSQLTSVAKRLQSAAAQSPVHEPLLLMTDQEGGEIRRIPGGPEKSARDVGQSGDPVAAATATGTEAGKTLRGAGLNLNLAPVAGVHRSSGDFLDQFGRSYGKDPAEVGKLAGAFAAAQQQQDVAATVKHFPGLGAASSKQNSDEGPVRLDQSLSTLRSVDEAPYPGVLAKGAKLVMPSWAVYPALDPKYPAGLSSKVLRGELRQRLGFQGVTISDAMEAGALKSFGSTGPLAEKAATAGMDLMLCSGRDAAQGAAAVDALAKGLQNGSLDKADFAAAANRVTNLRAGLK